jgi:hypothetical protein
MNWSRRYGNEPGRSRHSRTADARARSTPTQQVDLRTGLTHLLTPDAADAGLVALCGTSCAARALVDPGAGYCWDCRSTVPGQRSRDDVR